MILPAQQDHRSAAAGTGEVGEPDLVRDPHGAVRLAVPEGVDVRRGGVLGSENGRGRGLLVNAELVHSAAAAVQGLELGDDFEVESSKGGSLVPGDIGLVDRARPGLQLVAALLLHQQANDRLDACEEDSAFLQLVLVFDPRVRGDDAGPFARFQSVYGPLYGAARKCERQNGGGEEGMRAPGFARLPRGPFISKSWLKQ